MMLSPAFIHPRRKRRQMGYGARVARVCTNVWTLSLCLGTSALPGRRSSIRRNVCKDRARLMEMSRIPSICVASYYITQFSQGLSRQADDLIHSSYLCWRPQEVHLVPSDCGRLGKLTRPRKAVTIVL